MFVLSKAYFHDEAKAFEFVEAALWPQGPVCPHCGCTGHVYSLLPVRGSKSKKNPDGALRMGLKKCGDCRKQFTVRVGTIFEESHLALTKWLQAIFLLCSSKKGVSSHQLHRTLECTYKTAWFLSHRIREAMRAGTLPLMGGGGPVEVDETFIGHDILNPLEPGKQFGIANMNKVMSLVDRASGEARSFVIADLRMSTIATILDANVARNAWLMSDEAARYTELGWNFAGHGTVNHSAGEYGHGITHTNTVEGFYSIFKRGMRGVYQHCSKKHLHRYVTEFDFRYSNRVALGVDDQARADIALKGVVGKRLTYRRTDEWQDSVQS